MRRTPSSLLAVIVPLVIAGCATIPPPQGAERIEIVTHGWVRDKDPFTGASSPVNGVTPLEGVACAIDNDHDAWSVVAPDTIHVRPSRSELRFICAKQGFLPVRGALTCMSERTRQTAAAIGFLARVAVGAALTASAPPGATPSASGLPLIGGDAVPHTMFAEALGAGLVAGAAEGTTREQLASSDATADCTYLAAREKGVLHVYLVPE